MLRANLQHEIENLPGNAGLRGHDMREVLILKKERCQVLSTVAGAVAADQIWFKEQGRYRDGLRRLALDAVIQCAANDGKVPFIEGQQAVLDMAVRGARTKIENLKISMPVHANALTIVDRQEQDVHWTWHIERPHMHAFRVDLRFDEIEVIAVRSLRNWDTAREAAATRRNFRRRNNFGCVMISAQCGRPLRVGHFAPHAEKYED